MGYPISRHTQISVFWWGLPRKCDMFVAEQKAPSKYSYKLYIRVISRIIHQLKLLSGWWFGTWFLWLFIYWEYHNRNSLSLHHASSFFRGVAQNHQPDRVYINFNSFIFFRGVGQPPTSSWWMLMIYHYIIPIIIISYRQNHITIIISPYHLL